MGTPTRPRLSIVIKALNEERRIAVAIESALRACGPQDEIVVVDSLSTDRTVAIASRYPVRIVQFSRREDVCCGAAVQLGWQEARGEFIYILDGDMILDADFIARAMAVLDERPEVAGVAGRLTDSSVLTAADKQRVAYYSRIDRPAEVASLGGGGLYRRSAIEAVGYMSHRGLFAFEEAELGARLRQAGWSLLRLPEPAVSHEGHREGDLARLARLWRNGRAEAAGVLLRSGWGRPWFRRLAIIQWPVFAALALDGATLVLLAAGALLPAPGLVVGAVVAVALWLAAIGALSVRKRSLRDGILAVAMWHFYLAGAARGILRRPADPMARIDARELAPAAAEAGAPSRQVRQA